MTGAKIVHNVLFGFFLALSLFLSQTQAHGGIDDDAPTDTAASDIPSVYIKESGTMAKGNIGLGFGLTAIAAAACAIGSLAPYLDKLFPLLPFFKDFKISESKGFLAGSLSLASGVLLFLTLGDLFPEGISAFKTSNLFDKKYASLLATAIFVFTICAIFFVKHISKKLFGKNNCEAALNEDLEKSKESVTNEATVIDVAEKRDRDSDGSGSKTSGPLYDSKKMQKLSMQVAIGLTIHNFPEGLATFATTIASPRIGIVFAIALALHKFPEGLIISLPIYYATGSRLKAFLIASTVGVASQMAGALLGYLLFVTYWNDAVSGVLFSIVTGVLLYTVLHGMLPMAHKHDPQNKYVTTWTFIGLFFISIVAAIFDLA